MIPFQSYSKYYDIFYKDKDYEKESDFLEEIFKKYSENSVKTILNLGCGTGSHDLILAEKGYQLTGVDLSPQMLKIAKEKAEKENKNIDFIESDIRNIELQKKFDAVISMFAVMSYQTKNEDIISAFKCAANHLKKGGIFIFDCWFGPAVLKTKPEKRKKIIEQGVEKIERWVEPVLDLMKHTIDVNYKVIKKSRGEVLDEISESHKMRFFFPQEIKYFLEQTGFQVLKICPFMEIEKNLFENDWNITVIAKKV